jgi:predicted TIM-barrel fold metal-dependent hydrolase
VEYDEAGDWWVCDGLWLMSMTGGTDAGFRFESLEKMRREAKFSEVVKGGYIASEKLKDMDADGIYGEVVYPTTGLVMWRLEDSLLFDAICRTYNDWVAAFCKENPRRIKAVAMVNTDDIATGVAEIERAAKLGLAGAMISVNPGERDQYSQAKYEPLWAAAEEAQMPLTLHIGTHRAKQGANSPIRSRERARNMMSSPPFTSTAAHWFQVSVAHMIYSGVFDRFPRLQVISLEHRASWAPHFLVALDYEYTQRPPSPDWPRFRNAALPSDFFRRNVGLSFQEDALAVQQRHLIGIDCLTWGDDYPHPEGTFPRSQERLTLMLQGVPEQDRAKITGGNAARMYRFV